MTRQRIDVDWPQRRFFIIHVLKDPVEKSGCDEFDGDRIAAWVFPEPAMDSCARRDQCSMELIFSNGVITFVTLEVIRSLLAGGLAIRLPVKVVENPSARRPGI